MTLEPASKQMSVAVLGGGSGGHAMAYYLSSLGCRVRWWIHDPADAAAISKRGSVRAIGAFAGSVRLGRVSDDISAVVKDVELVFVVLPSSAHADVAAALAPCLRGDETLVLCPGRTGGAVAFKRSLGRFPELTIAETQSLIFTCRKLEPGLVDFLKFKDFGQIAFLGRVRPQIRELLDGAFPQMGTETSTLSTSLANFGAMLHPAPVLFNISRIEDSRASFLHYYEGITPTIARFIEKMDLERLELAAAYGVEGTDTSTWHELCYGLRGETLFETLRLNERYASLDAPSSLAHRYIYEDIPTGLVPMIALADVAGLEVPCMRSVLALADLVLDEEFMLSGRNADAMGIERGFSVEEVKQLFLGTERP